MAQVESPMISKGPPRVLVCEDEALTALRIQATLSALGCEVVGRACDGDQAVRMALRLQPDVILMDVNMPGMGGIEALRQIREHTSAAVVMLTAYGDPDTVRQALQAGATGYLVKPFRDQDLLPAISLAQARLGELEAERSLAKSQAEAAGRQVREALGRAHELGEALRREREVARALAESFLCPTPAGFPGLRIETAYEPAIAAELIGGDYYDFIELDSQHLGVVIGDACGKGIQAGTLTGVCRHTLRAYAVEDPAPDSVLRRLNRALCSTTSEECPFITLIYGVLDLNTFDFTYASAGHPSPVVCAPGGGHGHSLPATGGLLGADPEWEWTTGHARIPPRGALALFTDGILEARRGSELFGEERVQRAVCDLLGAPDVASALKEEARAFAGGDLKDDIAIVVLRRA